MENHPQERRFNHILHDNEVKIVNATKYTPKTTHVCRTQVHEQKHMLHRL